MSLRTSIVILMLILLVKGLNYAQRIMSSRNINNVPNLRTPMCIWRGVRRICPSEPYSYSNYNRLDKRIHDLAVRRYLRRRNQQDYFDARNRLPSQILNHLSLRNKLRAERRGIARKFSNHQDTNIQFGDYVRHADDYLNSFRKVSTTTAYENIQQTAKYYSGTNLYFDKMPFSTIYDSSSFQYLNVVQDTATQITPLNGFPTNSENPSILRQLKQDVVTLNPQELKTELSERISTTSMPTNNKSVQTVELQKDTKKEIFDSYLKSLDIFEREIYTTTFNKLIQISPEERKENGISFVQSGLLLSLFLMALSTETDNAAALEIDKYFRLNITDAEKINLIRDILSRLPKAKNELRWQWSSRLILGHTQRVSQEFHKEVAESLQLTIDKFNGTEQPEDIARILNRMVEEDSGGIIRDAFEPGEVSDGIRAVAVTTVNFRARWRSAPTVLNGTTTFRDVYGAPTRNIRMIRINDNMRYANFMEWSFEAIEIPYSTKGLSLLILVPYGPSLRSLARQMQSTSIRDIVSQMDPIRMGVSIPIYTLRMTLLLPSKLQAMGIEKIVSWNSTDGGRLRLSHAVQRVMFWAEAGRNAFKDDGVEWDETPAMELTIDRPYLFFVRWKNLTLMNGNFVL